MQKHWDSILVGVATFVTVALLLVNKPGYVPVTVPTDSAVIEDIVDDTIVAPTIEPNEEMVLTEEATATEEVESDTGED